MKRHLIIAVLSISSSLALAKSPAPKACPSANEIKTVPFMGAFETPLGYIDFSADTFGSNEMWALTLGFIQADSEEKAVKIGNEALQNLSGNPHPQQGDSDDEWVCKYNLPGGFGAVAFYPFDGLSKLKAQKYLSK
jgi:Domain of unknown function (DUF4949)